MDISYFMLLAIGLPGLAIIVMIIDDAIFPNGVDFYWGCNAPKQNSFAG